MSNDDLKKQIEEARAAYTKTYERPLKQEGQAKGMALGFRLATEFVVGPLVGAAIGWGLDLVFQTKPWMMIIWLMFGFAAGVLNVLRAVKGLQDSTGNGPVEGAEEE
ncbi:AtpZ/AtpI family protein [Hirschia maritima]|uniref:AtpZ/AtpI family protein n=1 Tax=Hirschia maritima TaxID=1121961 RepID=UPI00036AB3A9|nr:AtpZ/AtpI family protein [Hirschia maritima]